MLGGARPGLLSGLIHGASAGLAIGLMPFVAPLPISGAIAGVPKTIAVADPGGVIAGADGITFTVSYSNALAELGGAIAGADGVTFTATVSAALAELGEAIAGADGITSSAVALSELADPGGVIAGADAVASSTLVSVSESLADPGGVIAGADGITSSIAAIATLADLDSAIAGADGITSSAAAYNEVVASGVEAGGADGVTFTATAIASLADPGGVIAGADGVSSNAAAIASLADPGGVIAGADGVVEAAYQAETNALIALFNQSYTTQENGARNTLIANLKADGLWSTIDVLHIVAGAKSTNDATRNWKQNAYHASITGSLAFNSGRNFTGFSTSNYISDGFVPSTAGGNYAQNSATIAVYSTGDGQSSNVAIGGNNSANAIHSQIVLRNSSNQAAITNNATSSQTASATNTVYSAVGLTTNTRTASNAIAIYKNGTSIATGSTASTGNLSVQMFTGAQNNNATPASADTNLALVAEVKASGWNATQVSNFYSRLNTYLQTLKTSTYTLTYVSDGDTNGLFYLLGTNMGMAVWANPAQNSNPSSDSSYSNNYEILLSASTVGAGTLNSLTDRATSSFYTSNAANSWVKADIGGFRTLSCNKYSIRNYNSNGDWLRSWKLQGSNDNTNWTDLDIRNNDTTFNAVNVWATYTPNQGVSTAFRWFRILNTGLTSSSSNYLSLGEWELYGTLTISGPTTFTNSGLNGDNAGIIYYLASTQAAENWCNGWVNPHASGVVTVSASSVGGGNVSQLVNRTQNTFFTNNSAGSWIQLDFGASRTVRVDSYQLRNINSSSILPRNWKLQGSSNGSAWTDLDTRTSDATLAANNQFANFTCNQGNTSYWRYIRVLGTGVDSSGTNYVSLGQIELYGAIA